MDQDYYNTVAAEDKRERLEIKAAANKIISSSVSPKRKQQKWNDLFPRFALDGLSEEDLVF